MRVMPGRIPSVFIDQLLSRADIVEVINRRVPLKAKGREFAACCPFHDEKTPSFTVSPAKQFFHCFGCGESGSAIGFVMRYDNMGFVEAVESLAAELGLEVPREGAPDARAPRRRRCMQPSSAPISGIKNNCAAPTPTPPSPILNRAA